MKNIIINFIKFYKKYVSVYAYPRCRFVPVCSSYAIEAIQKHGVIKGMWLTIKRILKCNPIFKGGYDPVP